MKYTSIKKWALYALTIIIILSIVSCLGIKSQIKHHSGLNTTVVNSSQFKTLRGRLAITNVSVLSSDSQLMRDSLTVLINEHTIKTVGKNIKISKDNKRLSYTKLCFGFGKF